MSFLFNRYSKVYDRFMRLFKLDNNEDIIKIFRNIEGKEICDIGGGTGVLADALQKKGKDVTIIDPSVKMTNIAVKRNKNISIINSTLNNHKFNKKFDYIIFKDSLHHIKNQEDIIKKSIEILNDEGHIIIQEFSPSDYKSKIIFIFERFCLEKINPVNEKALVKIMLKYGVKGEIIVINKRDYIFLGKKVGKCQK